MWNRRSKRLLALIDEVPGLDNLAATIQTGDEEHGAEAAARFAAAYEGWYNERALKLVGDGLEERLRAEYDGTESQNRIRKFVEKPRAVNPVYSDDLEEEVKASISPWLYPYEETCHYPLNAQKHVLVEARAGVRRRSLPSVFLAGGGLGAIAALGVAVVTGLLGSNGDQTTPKPTTPSSITNLSQLEPCKRLPPDSPLAVQLRGRKQALIDSRCFKDPGLDISIYPGTKQIIGTSIKGLPHNYVLEDICLRKGDPVRDDAPTTDSNWVNFQYTPTQRANIPAIWTQGEEGAELC